jgi:hypothetical protein
MVSHQIAGGGRTRILLKIGRRSHYRKTQVSAKRDRDHITRHHTRPGRLVAKVVYPFRRIGKSANHAESDKQNQIRLQSVRTPNSARWDW